MKNISLSDRIGLAGLVIALVTLVIAIVGLVAAITIPEIRCLIGLEKCLPGSEEQFVDTEPIAGAWTGTLKSQKDDFEAKLDLFIEEECKIGQICGMYSVPVLPCAGNLLLQSIDNNIYHFVEQFTKGEEFCEKGGHEFIQLLPTGKLSWTFQSDFESESEYLSSAVLSRK